MTPSGSTRPFFMEDNGSIHNDTSSVLGTSSVFKSPPKSTEAGLRSAPSKTGNKLRTFSTTVISERSPHPSGINGSAISPKFVRNYSSTTNTTSAHNTTAYRSSTAPFAQESSSRHFATMGPGGPGGPGSAMESFIHGPNIGSASGTGVSHSERKQS